MAGGEEQLTIIVGAGPSGLSTAASLHRLSIPYIILERADCCASLWKTKTYDRLRLHLAKQFCQLPHLPFPPTYPTFVPLKDFVLYLDAYATRFDIKPEFKKSVESAVYDENAKRWRVRARDLGSGEEKEFSGGFLVVATGETADAFVPEVEGLGDFNGEVIHSTHYKSGEKYREKNVLVVGSGNSGMEIAFDLSTHCAHTSIVVRSPGHVLSREMVYVGQVLVKRLPYRVVDSILVFLSKAWYGDLTKYGIERPQDGPFTLKVKCGKYPIIDAGTCSKIKSGQIQVVPGIKRVKGGNEVEFENGKSHPFDAIVFATGFKTSTHKWLKGDDHLLNESGIAKQAFPNHWKGKNGIYCAGLSRRGLYGAGSDALNIADDIKSVLQSF